MRHFANAAAELLQNQSPNIRLAAIQRISNASADMFERGSKLEDAHRGELEKKLLTTGKASDTICVCALMASARR